MRKGHMIRRSERCETVALETLTFDFHRGVTNAFTHAATRRAQGEENAGLYGEGEL